LSVTFNKFHSKAGGLESKHQSILSGHLKTWNAFSANMYHITDRADCCLVNFVPAV